MKKFKRIGLVFFLCLFIGTLVFLYKKSSQAPVVYQTKTPFISDIVQKTVVSGSVVPRKEIEIKSRISGVIDTIFLEPGKNVEQGDLIARVKIIPNMISLNEAQARLSKAQITFTEIEQSFLRKQELLKKAMITEAEFQEIEAAFKSAKIELTASENNLQLIREGVAKDQRETSNTSIRSTINGMILDIPVKVGDSVIESNTFNNGTTIAVVADMQEMIFEGQVDESEVGKLYPGMDMNLTIGAIEDQTFQAKLEYIAPKGIKERETIQFAIRAKVTLNDAYFIRAGYSANADIVLDRRENVLVIDERLLQFERDEPFVEVEVAPQTFKKKPIETGLSDGLIIEVVSGVTQTEKIKVWN